MFLAWQEIKKNKLRFALITGVLMLVAYLVFFLSGLATGLQALNREAVDKWKANGIVLTEESDKSLYQSAMTTDQADHLEVAEKAILGQLSAIVSNGLAKENVSLFGIRTDEFLMPDVIEGEVFQYENEVVADQSLQESGFQIGDDLQISASDQTLKIVGFTDRARFNAAPVLYMTLETLQQIKFGEMAEQSTNRINGIVVRADQIQEVQVGDDLELIEIETFIQKLPGYTEQNLTLSFMIYFLFAISSIIVAIFLYVLTVQKTSMFGVMKAQGISNFYLSKSVIAQTFLLSFIGVAVGFLFTLLTGAFLPAAVPVSFDFMTMLLYGLVLIIVAIAGAVFSVWTIVRIDPLKAIGG